ncbi:hypothetical protein BD410DRAFT_787135 [Rickenella mellea]|uniref:Uncharacterized protein n=1 Tax=Rickenella mellea TaxID=50990 RepID=A0A4Y7Q956_9AGAM|nr:hypothetical protein BD410DRAFT_787135 [Rickenella mellea]
MSGHFSDIAYCSKWFLAYHADELKRYGVKVIDYEKPIPQNAGSITWSFPVYDTRHGATCKVVARVTPAENGMGGYLLDFVYDGSSACGKDGELIDRTDYFQVLDMYGSRMICCASACREACNQNYTGMGRAADLAGEGFTACLAAANCDKQVYLLAARGYYEVVAGPYRKRIVFDYTARNPFLNRLPRAVFVVED